MSETIEMKVPDIGDFSDVPVIEIHVKPGDRVKAEDSLITLESDKATMDVPASTDGIVEEIRLAIGDKVSEGTVILLARTDGSASPAVMQDTRPTVVPPPAAANAPAGVADVRVPDIGDFADVPVIEIHVKPGDTVKAEDPLVTLESDKATMDVPSPLAGVVTAIHVALGDKVGEGTMILSLATADGVSANAASVPAPVATTAAPPAPVHEATDPVTFALAYAGPAARKRARELGVDLGKIKGSGKHGRIVSEDVEAFSSRGTAEPASAAQSTPARSSGGSLDLLPWPQVDFAKFGPIEPRALSRIKKISGANLHRNWVTIPHVTTHDEADITDLEPFRVAMNKELEKSGVKLSLLPFMMKAAVAALKTFPEFNASLDGDSLILKRYWHIGFAADTPNGLVVPVIRDVDVKSIPAIADEMSTLAKLARDGKLKPDQMQGGTFTISSLGGIGGTYFTPIINAPEVAIMGVCKSFWKQTSTDGKQYQSRLTVPLSLSWDHRVIDGAAAARFLVHFSRTLADLRRALF
ncbi:dihydrolipoyllysine-residue acetyltransferase [Paraburkholderia flava]|uniref:dihydrolipoyllysine-residue acetyltransferase n=1 Tax=Paraburkholderia flava TaxID=2547393 RepID=UPI00105CAAB4|nr:dihydrolipoyllysine-residue acetyltransferase [Paraburkholderia flava]